MTVESSVSPTRPSPCGCCCSAALGFVFPSLFLDLRSWIPYLLAAVMLGMGLTLSVKDFAGVLRYPKAVLVGVCAQFLIMPALAWGLCKAFTCRPIWPSASFWWGPARAAPRPTS